MPVNGLALELELVPVLKVTPDLERALELKQAPDLFQPALESQQRGLATALYRASSVKSAPGIRSPS